MKVLPLVLENLMEIRDVLTAVDVDSDFGVVALFGCTSVRLPDDLAPQLRKLVGCKIAILRLDGYHLRDLDAETRR